MVNFKIETITLVVHDGMRGVTQQSNECADIGRSSSSSFFLKKQSYALFIADVSLSYTHQTVLLKVSRWYTPEY
jgi:hypothetical protein